MSPRKDASDDSMHEKYFKSVESTPLSRRKVCILLSDIIVLLCAYIYVLLQNTAFNFQYYHIYTLLDNTHIF